MEGRHSLTLRLKLQDIGNSDYPSTEEQEPSSVEPRAKGTGWHGWLLDLQVAEKALSRALYRLHKPAPIHIARTPPMGGTVTTAPLPAENDKQADPWKEWSNDIDFHVLQVNSASASERTSASPRTHSHPALRELTPKHENGNRDWPARPTRATTPTPDWPPIASNDADTLVKKTTYPPPVPRPPRDILDRIYTTNPRPCFNHYLLPQGCYFKIDCNTPLSIHNHNVKRCQRSHEVEFSPVEIEALRYVAQSLRCKDGINCTRENCYHGHQCQSTGICKGYGPGLPGGTCPFLPEEHREGKLASGARTVKDNLIIVDEDREKGGKIYAPSFKERRAAKLNPTITATAGKATRTAPDKVASLVFNDLCQILRPGNLHENSNEPEDADVGGVGWKYSPPALSLLD